MAEPKKRMTSTRSGNRQSHDALKATSSVKCSHCKTEIPGHKVCKVCGYYRNKKILTVKDERKKQNKLKEDLKDE